jgi:uncharacterized protein YwbE
MKNKRWFGGNGAVWLAVLVVGLGLTLPALAEVQSVFCKEGKFWVVTDGATSEIASEVKLPHEVIVNTNGMFIVDKGKERKLEEGQRIGRDGMLLSTDGSIGPVYDHIAVKGGKVVVVRDGVAAALAAPMSLPNGAVINPDSSMIKPGGMQVRLVDGQLFALDGTPIATKDTISLQSGKVVLQRDGTLITLQPIQITEMSDGTRVTGNGLVTYRDGRKVQLTEGQIITVNGVAR